MTSSRTREIVCGFLRFNFQGKTMDNEPDDIDEDDYEEDENDLGDLLTNDDWEDTKVYAEIRAAMPSGWIMTKVTNFNSQKLRDIDEWCKLNCKAEWKKIGRTSNCAYSVAMQFADAMDAVYFKLRWS
jgi:hypothetical protein